MALEIERKFLVDSMAFKDEAYKSLHIKQGFLCNHKKRVVRIRVCHDKGYITVKGKSRLKGLVRYEWEKIIPKKEAEELLLLCPKQPIEKIRYLVLFQGQKIEIDEFLAKNKGLIIAEIELNDLEESYKKPTWLGQEVTGQAKYYNACLSKNPYINWKKETLK